MIVGFVARARAGRGREHRAAGVVRFVGVTGGLFVSVRYMMRLSRGDRMMVAGSTRDGHDRRRHRLQWNQQNE